MSRRRDRNRSRHRRQPPLVSLAPFLLATLYSLLFLYATTRQTGATVALATAPTTVALDGFYDPEQNDRFSYRWTAQDAELRIPVRNPGDYQIALTMQDAEGVPQPRTVAIALNDQPVEQVTLEPALRTYLLRYRLTPQRWLASGDHALALRLQTAPYRPPGETRAFGPLVSSVTITPLALLPGWILAALSANLLLVLVLWWALRQLGLAPAVAATLLGGGLLALAALAIIAPGESATLIYEAVIHPVALLGTVALLAAAPFLARHDRPLPRWTLPALPPGLGHALWLFLVLRVTLSLASALLPRLTTVAAPCSWTDGPPRNGEGAAFTWLGVWQRWDACRYADIAANGYPPDSRTVAFFPLYPALLRAGAILTDNLTLVGLIVSGLAFIAAMTGLYRLVARDFDEVIARRTVLYTALFPAAFFFFAPFTESLFLALVVWTILTARERRWLLAALLGLLAALTRVQGVLLLAPLAWEGYRAWREREHWRGALLATITPVAGLLLANAYFLATAGITTFEGQRRFNATLHTPWAVVSLAWQDALANGNAIEGLNIAALLIFGLLLAAGARRLPLTYTLYALAQFVLVATRANYIPLTSTMRLLLVIFPPFVVLALAGRDRRFHLAWLIVSLLLLGLLLVVFNSGRFVA